MNGRYSVLVMMNTAGRSSFARFAAFYVSRRGMQESSSIYCLLDQYVMFLFI